MYSTEGGMRIPITRVQVRRQPHQGRRHDWPRRHRGAGGVAAPAGGTRGGVTVAGEGAGLWWHVLVFVAEQEANLRAHTDARSFIVDRRAPSPKMLSSLKAEEQSQLQIVEREDVGGDEEEDLFETIDKRKLEQNGVIAFVMTFVCVVFRLARFDSEIILVIF
ncbi:hypothetical protein NL676_010829 [Syzygium grande]|nr:hypothetical protein NL676_010829 [Syzygium grande]